MTGADSWLIHSGHRKWLWHNFSRVLEFALPSILPDCGFAYQGADGRPMPGRRPQLFLTARMVATAALGVQHGIPGAGELLDHGMASLLGCHRDLTHGGWFTEPGAVTRKSTYDHVHVGLAAARALEAGHPRAEELLALVIAVVEERLWDQESGTVRESFAPDWSDSEAYRGANANMHTLEAFLEMGRATGDPVWHERGLRIADRIINGAARLRDWLIPEHFDESWAELPDYNVDEPLHPFRPYGATLGHSLEWARFLLDLDRSGVVSAPWLIEAAEGLTRRALDGGWALDGRPGLVYTVDWAGRPVADVRLHWPVCEGIQVTADLVGLGPSADLEWAHWEAWYRRLWDHAARYFVDDRGAWRNELADDLTEGGRIWPGRPDVYHCGGALAGSLAAGDRLLAANGIGGQGNSAGG